MDLSIIQYFGKHSDKCGYCKGVKCNSLHGMHAYTMNVNDYQDLIDRGWRRSGQYCYKPENNTTCCPSYTIKCNALEFKMNKSHKKILKRMNRFLRDGKHDKSDESATKIDKSTDAVDTAIREEPQVPDMPLHELDLQQITTAHKAAGLDAPRRAVEAAENLTADKLAASCTTTTKQGTSKNSETNPPCKKAKQIRLERRQAKLAEKGIAEADIQTKTKTTTTLEKTLSDYINEPGENYKHKLKIVLIASKTQKNITNEYQLYRKYQLAIHNDNPTRITPAQMQRFLYKTPLKLKLVKSHSSEFLLTLKHSFALYRKYQIRIHNDPPEDVDSYISFCRTTPLQYKNESDGPEMGYGSFHQQYWLDDKLIAVGVIDVLPYCVSSVYFFYDPDYSFLSLGTYGSLREIELVQRLAAQTAELKYYYMGFYIHSCPKMRYKGKLQPSYLLCPETYTWHLLTDEILQKLDVCKYQRLCNDEAVGDKTEFKPNEDLNRVQLLLDNNTLVPYGTYIQLSGEVAERERIIEYCKLVGKVCALRMLYVLDA